MTTPFSTEELARIKSINFKEYVSMPILYQAEIEEIFFKIIPRLIEVAEQNEAICAKLADNKDPLPLSVNQIKLLKRLLDSENEYISALETDCQALRKYHTAQIMILNKTDLPIEIEIAPEIEVPSVVEIVPEIILLPKVWYRRFFDGLKRKSH